MALFDSWNQQDDEEDDELQDATYYEGKKDIILFCIDCSESMHELRDDPNYEDVKTSHIFTALDAAMQIQKRKVIVGPNDAVGIMLFNMMRENDRTEQGSEIKKNNFIYQQITIINAPKVHELKQLLDAAREDPTLLRTTFPPLVGKRAPMGDVFTSCNWVMRDGAPKTATKRVFLITDEDNPHRGMSNDRLITSARTTLLDLTQAGINLEPFFISTDEKPFNTNVFYSSVLLPSSFAETDDSDSGSVLPESISISRIDDLLSQMRFHEVPKRAQFSIPLRLADGFVIGIKGYGLITEQKKGSYKYFADLGDGSDPQVAISKTAYVDDASQMEADKSRLLFGMTLGTTAATEDVDEGQSNSSEGSGARMVPAGNRVFYTTDEVRSFRTMGLEPMIKLLGFKDRKQLTFEDNVKHSLFIYPDEMSYAGSKRTFSALLQTMLKKKKIALVLALTRRNASPTFCAMLPQAEKVDESGWNEPPGFHLIPLPYADDIRAAPIEEAVRASDDLKDAARKWIDKLSVKNGTYNPDSFPNPSLAFHNSQLEASAFREEYDPETFEDKTEPVHDRMHQRAGQLMKAWKTILQEDESANAIVVTTGMKRKADISVDEAEIRSKYESDQLSKLRVDQLKEFLKSKSQPIAGKKAELIDRVGDWLDSHA